MKYLIIILSGLALLLLAASGAPAAAPDKMAQADALLQGPNLTFEQARRALVLYEQQLSGPPPLFLRLTRTSFVLGDMAPQDDRADYYKKGLAYAEKLLQEEPRGAAGHYWKAMNLCGQADTGGRIQGLKLLPKILEELKQVLTLEETYDQAGAHRVLGRIYFEAPAWPISVGDRKKSLQHLTAAVRLAPDNSTNHLYLAETLLAQGQKDQAQAELEKVLQAKSHAIRPQGLEDDRREAKRLLEEIKKKK